MYQRVKSNMSNDDEIIKLDASEKYLSFCVTFVPIIITVLFGWLFYLKLNNTHLPVWVENFENFLKHLTSCPSPFPRLLILSSIFLIMNIVATFTVLSRVILFSKEGIKIYNPWLLRFGSAILGDRLLEYIRWNEIKSIEIFKRAFYCLIKIRTANGRLATIKVFGKNKFKIIFELCLRYNYKYTLMEGEYNMNKLELKHDIVSKIEWTVSLIIGLLGSGFLIFFLIMVIRFWGELIAGASAVAALFILPQLYTIICAVVEHSFVWSRICIEGTKIIQIRFKQKVEIDLTLPWVKSYGYVFFRTPTLRNPYHQWVEIQQGNSAVRFMPRRLIPKVTYEMLPEQLRDIWKEYEQRKRRRLLDYLFSHDDY